MRLSKDVNIHTKTDLLQLSPESILTGEAFETRGDSKRLHSSYAFEIINDIRTVIEAEKDTVI